MDKYIEEVPLSKILIDDPQIKFVNLIKIRTNSPPLLEKNIHGEYKVQDGRHRLYAFYYWNKGLPHETKVKCQVIETGDKKHYHGWFIWQIIERLEKSKLSFWERGKALFSKPKSLFFPSITNEVRKALSRKTRRLLEKAEEQLLLLYSDFERRIHEWMVLIYKEKHTITSQNKINALQMKELSRYISHLEALVGVDTTKEQKSVSLLDQLAIAIQSEIVKPISKEIKKNIKIIEQILQGKLESEVGIIKILSYQLEIIKKGKIPDNLSKLKQLLEEERKFLPQFNKNYDDQPEFKALKKY